MRSVRINLFTVILMGWFAGELQAKTVEVGEQMRGLVEADWLGRGGDISLAQTQEVLQRARQLADRLQLMNDSAGVLGTARPTSLLTKLRECERKLTKLQMAKDVSESDRREIYLESHRVAREIAFANPLLRDVKRLLFITRHDAKGIFHMVDQFYGFNAQPGGALLALEHPFSSKPKLINLLENSVVEKGRLKGRKLEGGAFLSPEVSFDGKTILFAWTEGKGKDLEWSPSASYHIFKVNADGTRLVQLTDGPWNDFDPCFLPNGRIVFVSERRGGFLRCGRYCPTYTLFTMAADGSEVACLSYHETHEWQPSITADGRIVYTRWDYVDRDTNMAHHPWTCRPDGGDPRAFHGNYPIRRESRPWMEMDVRAIPGSRKFVATAGAHHGHAFGSLVVIDPETEDDNAQSQLTRLTPEVPFPEAEKHLRPIAECMVYGTVWPLSEEDFLCVYDAGAKNVGGLLRNPPNMNRGVYWIDRFGNKELVYRNPKISCLSPMPLQARLTPPVIPAATVEAVQAPKPENEQRPGTIAVLNVYNSDFTWPKGTKITSLRIIQVLPKSTPAPNEPRIGVADQSNARAVLGAVPVEKDGSAYFEAPPGKEIYFQALNEEGLAVQSMRSGTYLHAGERLVCQGCHEARTRASRPHESVPLALRRAPSKIQPDVDGSNPFNFVRLVQPVLDRNCVACHREKTALDLTAQVEGKHGWTRSYSNLAGKYGFYFHVSNGSINAGVHGGSRTTAGQFGALRSPLLAFLDERHYGVKLSAEDFHRLTLWLDCNSEFYGSYEKIQEQARGEVVFPTLH